MNVHLNTFPYQCNFQGCTQAFKQRGKLANHRAKCHPEYKQKKYKLNSHLNDENAVDDFSDKEEEKNEDSFKNQSSVIQIPVSHFNLQPIVQ